LVVVGAVCVDLLPSALLPAPAAAAAEAAAALALAVEELPLREGASLPGPERFLEMPMTKARKSTRVSASLSLSARRGASPRMVIEAYLFLMTSVLSERGRTTPCSL
jgi:hypothetical protein